MWVVSMLVSQILFPQALQPSLNLRYQNWSILHPGRGNISNIELILDMTVITIPLGGT